VAQRTASVRSCPARLAVVRLAVVIVLTGAAAGLSGAALVLVLHLVQRLAYGPIPQGFLQAAEHAGPQRRCLVLALAGVLVGAGWYALRRFAAPVPSVGAAVAGGGRLPLAPVTVDAVLQVAAVALGASLGREGAPRQVGAALAGRLAELAHLTLRERRVLLAAGAGAGLAAVYDVPLGGAVFTVEVLLGAVSALAVTAAAATAGIATAVALLLVPGGPTYLVGPASPTAAGLLVAALSGPLLGLAALGFTGLTDAAASRRPRGWHLPLAIVGVFAALGVVAIAFPQLLGNGRGAAQLAFEGTASIPLLAALALLKPLVTAACLGSGARGGRLTPALATGALLGALLAHAAAPLLPSVAVRDVAVAGAAGFLAVSLRGPLTALVLVLELTHGGAGLVLPCLLAIGSAVLTARAVAPRLPAGSRPARAGLAQR